MKTTVEIFKKLKEIEVKKKFISRIENKTFRKKLDGI